jgi:hypothetical protein
MKVSAAQEKIVLKSCKVGASKEHKKDFVAVNPATWWCLRALR